MYIRALEMQITRSSSLIWLSKWIVLVKVIEKCKDNTGFRNALIQRPPPPKKKGEKIDLRKSLKMKLRHLPM